jgi:hypothetical protein
MRLFIAARVKLLKVLRALVFDERGKPIAAIYREVKSMEQYLSKLIEEFEEKYKPVSRMKSVYEARMKFAVEVKAKRLQTSGADAAPDPSAGSGPAEPPLPANEPWDAIAKPSAREGFHSANWRRRKSKLL